MATKQKSRLGEIVRILNEVKTTVESSLQTYQINNTEVTCSFHSYPKTLELWKKFKSSLQRVRTIVREQRNSVRISNNEDKPAFGILRESYETDLHKKKFTKVIHRAVSILRKKNISSFDKNTLKMYITHDLPNTIDGLKYVDDINRGADKKPDEQTTQQIADTAMSGKPIDASTDFLEDKATVEAKSNAQNDESNNTSILKLTHKHGTTIDFVFVKPKEIDEAGKIADTTENKPEVEVLQNVLVNGSVDKQLTISIKDFRFTYFERLLSCVLKHLALGNSQHVKSMNSIFEGAPGVCITNNQPLTIQSVAYLSVEIEKHRERHDGTEKTAISSSSLLPPSKWKASTANSDNSNKIIHYELLQKMVADNHKGKDMDSGVDPNAFAELTLSPPLLMSNNQYRALCMHLMNMNENPSNNTSEKAINFEDNSDTELISDPVVVGAAVDATYFENTHAYCAAATFVRNPLLDDGLTSGEFLVCCKNFST